MFRSFYLAGFECATGYNMHGEWIDQIAATEHDRHVDADYDVSPTSASTRCARRSAGRSSIAAAATTSRRWSRSSARPDTTSTSSGISFTTVIRTTSTRSRAQFADRFADYCHAAARSSPTACRAALLHADQ